jgi:hypothetical protein
MQYQPPFTSIVAHFFLLIQLLLSVNPQLHPRTINFTCGCRRRQVLRHDIGDKKDVGKLSEAFPHLIFDGFTSKLGARVQNILKHVFPVPKVIPGFSIHVSLY